MLTIHQYATLVLTSHSGLYSMPHLTCPNEGKTAVYCSIFCYNDRGNQSLVSVHYTAAAHKLLTQTYSRLVWRNNNNCLYTVRKYVKIYIIGMISSHRLPRICHYLHCWVVGVCGIVRWEYRKKFSIIFQITYIIYHY